jgi:putative ABC transport system substrate-binding protein
MLGLAVAAPLAARAQQSQRVRRLGVLMPYAASDPQAQARSEALVHGLQRLGWSDGSNIKIDYRWSTGNEDDVRKNAGELVALAPDVIFAAGSAGVGPMRHATRTIPIVFVLIPDPVGAGFAESMAQPGGNIRPLAARGSRKSIRSRSDREGVNRRIDWPGRIVRSERTL